MKTVILKAGVASALITVLVIVVAWVVADQHRTRRIAELPCASTLDDIPTCSPVEMPAEQCLAIYPPDEVGNYCDWYGYATKRQIVQFEHRRGFSPVLAYRGMFYTPVTAGARAYVACREAIIRSDRPLADLASCQLTETPR